MFNPPTRKSDGLLTLEWIAISASAVRRQPRVAKALAVAQGYAGGATDFSYVYKTLIHITVRFRGLLALGASIIILPIGEIAREYIPKDTQWGITST